MGEEPEGLAPAASASTTVKFDWYHKPLPEIPLPNDIATRADPTSATGLRVNASLVAPTGFERRVRALIDELDGWGIFQPITIPFTGALDVTSITSAHDDADYDLKDDVVYLVNVDRASPEFGRIHHLDLGNGNFPVVLESLDKYWKNDPRGWTLSLLFEEADEDINKNGKLDPGEDTDHDGVLDVPNYLPGKAPTRTDLGGRADALMTFYERETHTLILRTLMPLRERTTYAVLVTRRLKDKSGNPVGSPFPYINHAAQNEALEALPEVLPGGLSLSDVAFAFAFTTQSVKSQIRAVREGLYGRGVQAHIGSKFPAQLQGLETLWDKDSAAFKKAWPSMQNPYILYTEQFAAAFKDVVTQLLGEKEDTVSYKKALQSASYVDYHVIGSFASPQLFERYANPDETDPEKRLLLDYNLQSWPQDLHRTAARTRRETVYFWLTVPRKEVSPERRAGKPAPVVIIGHGYGGNRTDVLTMGGYLARHGIASIGIDCVSHGLGFSQGEMALAQALVAKYGLQSFLKAVLKDRAIDHNNDGKKDSGADFWSAYTFHTRDMVRQSALDYMQLVRVLRSFDGTRKWAFDADGDGEPDLDGLAGDFDGDGKVDVGKGSLLGMTGGSLGGIMSLTVGGIEPHLDVIVPVAGGAGLGDVGIRSRQGGVPEAFLLRVMGPLFVGTRDSKTGVMKLETIVPDLNDDPVLHFADLSGVQDGDTVVLTNLKNKKLGCARVDKGGTFRAAVESDTGDVLKLELYRGDIIAGPECKLAEQKGTPYATVTKLDKDIFYQNKTYAKGTDLIALTEGLGLRRASPSLRRFTSFANFIIEPGDPVAYARHLLKEPLSYRESATETVKTGTHSLIVTTVGDMNVPASSGVTAGRAAGIIGYLEQDPRLGKTHNQALIDTYMAEAVHTLGRYTHRDTGAGVHIDVDNFSQGTDLFGSAVPRLTKPLRIGLSRKDPLGGVSGAIFPYNDPSGTHGFDRPGQMTDRFVKACKKACKKTGGTDPCGCESQSTFDIGDFMFNAMGRYFNTGGTKLDLSLCNATDTCADLRAIPVPKARGASELK